MARDDKHGSDWLTAGVKLPPFQSETALAAEESL
jgi:hypothetical protein